MAGRFAWSTTSDIIGRKPIYAMYLGVGIVFYFLLATVGHNSTALFVLFAAVILSFYGGGFATVPAYLRDLFGTYQVGAIHGRLLTAWSVAGVAGPLIVNGFLDREGKPGTLTAAAGARVHRQPADPPGRRPVPREDRDHGSGGSEMNQTPRLVISWALVAVLLGYGVIQTLITAAKLFTH
jgi:MFS family permease